MLNILINKFIKHGKSLQRTKVNKGKWVSRFSVFFFFWHSWVQHFHKPLLLAWLFRVVTFPEQIYVAVMTSYTYYFIYLLT